MRRPRTRSTIIYTYSADIKPTLYNLIIDRVYGGGQLKTYYTVAVRTSSLKHYCVCRSALHIVSLLLMGIMLSFDLNQQLTVYQCLCVFCSS